MLDSENQHVTASSESEKSSNNIASSSQVDHGSEVNSAEKPVTSFTDLGLSPTIVKVVESIGFTAPTETQIAAIPSILAGRDMVVQAETGSGKTAAFVLPCLEVLSPKPGVEVLILVPTRELAQQVVAEIKRLAHDRRIQAVTVIGGQPIMRQADAINAGAKFVVATPGRLLDHLRSKRLRAFAPTTLILDEADEMLDMGFIDDIKQIMAFLSAERQTLLFSATMPTAIKRLVEQQLTDPKEIKLVAAKQLANDRIEQILHVVGVNEKSHALVRSLDAENPSKAIIFCRTKRDVDDLNRILLRSGFHSKALHGDISQAERTRVVADMRRGDCNVLVATDVASRGLDIEGVTHVFNYHLPEYAERFIHRVGRTGRQGRSGKAITLVTEAEWQRHSFFRQYPRKQFSVEQVASRQIVEAARDERLVEQIKQVNVNDAARERFAELGHEDAVELLCKMFTYIRGQRPVRGPNEIGLDPKVALKSLTNQRPSSYRGNSSSRPYQRSSARRPYQRSQGQQRRPSSSSYR